MTDHSDFSELADFIRSQPADRKVCHETWSTCAVGDYCREYLGLSGKAILEAYDYIEALFPNVGRSASFGEEDPLTSRLLSVLNVLSEYDANTYQELTWVVEQIEEDLRDPWDYGTDPYEFTG